MTPRFPFGLLGAAILVCALAAVPALARDGATLTPASLPPPDGVATQIDRQSDYRIGPLDTLQISVFQVQYLDQPVQVGADGHIDLPLIGDVAAAGKTPRALADEIAAKLGAKYLQSPQVSVAVKDAEGEKFTVEGSVQKPGVYDAMGDTTLMQAVALAQGSDQYANEHKVAVFRTVDKARISAMFDLAAIREGKAPDPKIYGGDIIVVGGSAVKNFLRNIAPVSPFASLIRPY